MARMVMKRLLVLPIALLAAHFFGYFYAYPGPVIPGQRVEPLVPNYLAYLQNAARLDFGTFPGGIETITERVSRSLAASFGLLALALFFSVILGVLLGVRAARANPAGVARWMAPFSTLGLAMPGFYLGSLFIVAGIYYAILGGPDAKVPLPLQGFGWDLHLVLPVLVLMFRPVVQISQVTADLLANEFDKQYVTAARSLGFTWQAIRGHHAFRNGLAGIIVAIAVSARLLVGELIVVEWLFAWPGLGRLLILVLVPNRSFVAESYLFSNPPLVGAILALLAAFFLLVDLVSAVLVQSVDARLREAS